LGLRRRKKRTKTLLKRTVSFGRAVKNLGLGFWGVGGDLHRVEGVGVCLTGGGNNDKKDSKNMRGKDGSGTK